MFHVWNTMLDSAPFNEWKKELAYYSVYVKVATLLLIALTISVVLFVIYKTFYLATIVGGALSGIFGIITVMAQESHSRRKVAKIIVEVNPEVHWRDSNLKTKNFSLGLVQVNKGFRAGNKVVTFIRLYIKIQEGAGLPTFNSTEGLVDISEANNCPFPAGVGQAMIKVFESKQDLFGVRYPGINVPFGKIGVDGDFIKDYRALTLEADTYEEFTHSNRKFLLSWSDPPKDTFPTVKVLSEKFEHY